MLASAFADKVLDAAVAGKITGRRSSESTVRRRVLPPVAKNWREHRHSSRRFPSKATFCSYQHGARIGVLLLCCADEELVKTAGDARCGKQAGIR